ncbi:hypothetical protein OIU74_023456 [Salix koriyanagi]|uniref:Uncharacterized protein n=1 Tax=Salix koriyanagi TaxID=2511006 RepID=A0A9Q0WD88_9ROSI|nr:hypothetical protein OIU74_023456 [Salix koriyanagi]
MDRRVPLQEPPARAMDLTGILIGGGVLVRLVDGVMGLVQVGPRMGSVRVSGMDQALEAGGQAQDTVMGSGSGGAQGGGFGSGSGSGSSAGGGGGGGNGGSSGSGTHSPSDSGQKTNHG